MLGTSLSAFAYGFILAALVTGNAAARAADLSGNESALSHGRFKHLAVYAPVGSPASFVLLLSGDDGWSGRVVELAQQLRQRGAMVVGIDLREFEASLEADGAECVFADGDLENLSHFVQAYYHLPSYLTPMLVGYSSGASLAYAALAQAPRTAFYVALSFSVPATAVFLASANDDAIQLALVQSVLTATMMIAAGISLAGGLVSYALAPETTGKLLSQTTGGRKGG